MQTFVSSSHSSVSTNHRAASRTAPWPRGAVPTSSRFGPAALAWTSVVHCRTFVSGCARPSSWLIICDLLEGLPLAPAPAIAPEAALLPALLPKEVVVAPNSPVDRGLCALNATPVASAEVLTLLLVYPGCR